MPFRRADVGHGLDAVILDGERFAQLFRFMPDGLILRQHYARGGLIQYCRTAGNCKIGTEHVELLIRVKLTGILNPDAFQVNPGIPYTPSGIVILIGGRQYLFGVFIGAGRQRR